MKRSVSFSLLAPAAAAALAVAGPASAAAPGVDAIVHAGIVKGVPFDGHATLDVLFATSAPLTRKKDGEGTLRFPGGVGVNSTAYAKIYEVETGLPGTHEHHCYAAEAPPKVAAKAKPGDRLHVQIALSNDTAAPRLKRDLRVWKALTERKLALQYGC